MKKSILQHAAIAVPNAGVSNYLAQAEKYENLRENKSISVEPLRIRWAESQESVEKNMGHRGHPLENELAIWPLIALFGLS